MKPVRSGMFIASIVSLTLFGGIGVLHAQDQTQTRDQDQLRKDQPATDRSQTRTGNRISDREIYGYQLMTQQERDGYRAKMRAATTAQEREQIRAEHHTQMQARAQERGMTLPDQPRAGAAGSTGAPGPRGPGAGGGAGSGAGGGGRR